MKNHDHGMAAVIFDLDNCLAPADGAGKEVFAPAFEAISAANKGSVPAELLQQAFSDIWIHSYDWVSRRYGFTAAMHEAGWNAFAGIEINPPMKAYADLEELGGLPVDRFLVTSGFRRLQESKIRALGIASLFHEIVIDAIDEAPRKGKRLIFQEIIERYGYGRQGVLIVGDNPESEIAAGNSLGIRTVQILRPGIRQSHKARHHIAGLSELPALINGGLA